MRGRFIELVEKLTAEPGPVVRLLGGAPAHWESLLAELEELGVLEAALGLLPVALSRRGIFREEVLAALDRLVRRHPSAALVGLEARARERTSEWHSAAWMSSSEVTPERLDAIAGRVTALGIASLHGSGWVRERAVRLLADSDDALAPAFLLLRANDWVDPVRQAAIESLERRLADRGVDELVPHLELVFRLTDVRRNDLRGLTARVEQELASPEAAASLQRACGEGTARARRRCLDLALRARTFDVRFTLLASLDDRDRSTRVAAAHAAGSVFAGEELRALLRRLRTSRVSALRRAALEVAAERVQSELRDLAEGLLLDADAAVRAAARRHLRTTAAPPDAASRYRTALAQRPERLAAAILGLGETGAPADAALVEVHLLDDRARVRSAAVSALGSLAAADHRSDFIALIADPSPRVARAACDVLLRLPAVELSLLVEAAVRGEHPSQRRCGVDLVVRHDHWAAGLAWLRIAREGEEEIAARAKNALERWANRYNRVYTVPSRDQVAAYQRETTARAWNDQLGAWLRDLAAAMSSRLA
jgi:hypothetical protein